YPFLPASSFSSQVTGCAVSLRGGAVLARSLSVSASRKRTKFFPPIGSSGNPSWPATKKLSCEGITKVRERNVPVRFSPPGGRLQINCASSAPSAERRFCRNQGSADSFPLMGRLYQPRDSSLTESSNLSANSVPQLRRPV